MIRKFAHSSVDFTCDVIAELIATVADVGPHVVSMFRRTRERWAMRRASDPVATVTFLDEHGVDDLRDNLSGLDILESAFVSQNSRDYASV